MTILNWIKDKAVAARTFVAQQVENVKASRLAQAAQPAVTAVTNGVNGIKSTIGAGIAKVTAAGTNAVNTAKATVSSAATAAAVSVASYALKAKIDEVAKTAREAAAALAAKTAQWISQTITKLAAAFLKFVQSIISIFANLFTGFMDRVRTKIARAAGVEVPGVDEPAVSTPVLGFSQALTQTGKMLLDEVVRAVSPTPDNNNTDEANKAKLD